MNYNLIIRFFIYNKMDQHIDYIISELNALKEELINNSYTIEKKMIMTITVRQMIVQQNQYAEEQIDHFH